MTHFFTPRWKTFLLGMGLGLPLWTSAQSAQQPISPIEARNLAAAQLGKALEWLPPDHLEQFGFSDRDDLSAISIGIPVYSTSFTDESVINGVRPGMQTHMILLPLSLQGTVRCFLYISPDEAGRWIVAGLGGHNEASTWSDFLTGKNAPLQDQLSLLHIPQNNADYLWQENSHTWRDISVGPGHHNAELLNPEEAFQQAVKIAAEARATVKEDAGS